MLQLSSHLLITLLLPNGSGLPKLWSFAWVCLQLTLAVVVVCWYVLVLRTFITVF